MARKFIIHIGPAKTGTSSLQEALFDHRDALLEHGVSYPNFGRHRTMRLLPGHHGIPGLLRAEGRLPQDVVEALTDHRTDETIVFSSEDFANLDPAAIRPFAALLGKTPVEVIYYARRWDHLLPSIWQELIKHGYSRPYLEFLNTQVTAPRASRNLNYMIPLDAWREVFGRNAIRIFSYDNIREEGGGIVDHFFAQVLGLPLKPPVERRENTRQSAGLTEIMRMLNRLTFRAGPSSPRVRTALVFEMVRVADELDQLEALFKGYRARARLCAPMVFASVEKQFLNLYGSRIGNLTDKGRLFSDTGFEPTEYIQQDYLFETEALQMYRRILHKIGIRDAEKED